MTTTDVDQLWSSIDDQRQRTADLLDQLTIDEWLHPSLCEGWNVRHVAAHLTLQQQRFRDAVAFAVAHPAAIRGLTLNRTIHDTALVQAKVLETDEISARIRGMIGSRRHNVFVTPRETLTDILVHSQDIAVPLGHDLAMDPVASAMAATRCWDTRGTWLAKVFRRLPLEDYRFTATDVDWSRGQGAEITGPMGAILLVLTGRKAGLDGLHGPGVESLRRAT